MKLLVRAYSLFNILSLDVAAGACITSAAVCVAYGLQPSPAAIILLGNAIWIIYTLDHYYDALASRNNASSRRRAFHIQYRRPLLILLAVAFAAEVVLLIQTDFRLMKYGLPAFVITGLYLLLNWLSQRRRKKFYLKELMISAGYVAGILTIPSSYTENEAQALRMYLGPGLFLFFTALANVLLIAWYEAEADRREQQVSAAEWIPRRVLRWLIAAVIVCQLATAREFIFPVAFLMVLIFAALLIFPSFFEKNEVYRKLVDSVFLAPALFLVYNLFS